MSNDMSDLWMVPIIRGVSAIAFGILLMVWPAASIGVVALIFASLFALYGVMDIITGIHGMSKSFTSILRVLLGFVEIGIVVYLFRNAGSGLTLALMGLLMAVNLIVLSFAMVGLALLSDAPAAYRWVSGFVGIVSLFAGITIARAPAISIVTIIYTLGIFGLIVGPVEIASGLMLRNQNKKITA